MQRIVLTGGPCAGKTRCFQKVLEEFSGKVLGVGEIATQTYLGLGLPPSGYPDWNRAFWDHPPLRREFQAKILEAQWQREKEIEDLAKAQGIGAVLCDRGLLDGSAYWPGGLADFLSQFQLDLNECHGRYRQIIHLESTAMDPGDLYSSAENSTRREPKPEAMEREKRTIEAWNGHPNRFVVRVADSIEKKIRATLDQVARILG